MAIARDSDRDQAIGVDFRDWLDEFTRLTWRQGEHVALLGPTGCGKSTLACHLLGRRKYVIALDPKGGDSTLGALEERGVFERIDQWPPPKRIREQIGKGEPARLIIGSKIRSRAERPALRATLERAIDGVFEEGSWTLYVDELQIAADRRFMNLTAGIEENLISARDRKVSVVTSFQRPANVPRTASDQARYFFTWYTRDVDVVNRLAEMMGRERARVRGWIQGLEEYAVLVTSNNPHRPVLVTWVPEL
jgi:hypothetical protein